MVRQLDLLPISNKEIQEWEALTEAATAGPWFAVPPPWGDGTLVVEGDEDPHGRMTIADCFGWEDREENDWSPEDNAAFIAMARQAIPRLLAERARLLGELKEAHGFPV